MALPRLIALKSKHNNKYLRYKHEDVEDYGFLEFSGESTVSPFTRFEVEPAKCGNGLVHVRCCYNNKYWVRSSKDLNWIAGAADEPNEDQSDWLCTLFKPVTSDSDDGETIRFMHVRLGHFASFSEANRPSGASFSKANRPSGLCLVARSQGSQNGSHDLCTFTNLASSILLPKHVAFKGDNGLFLSARWIEGYKYLMFASSDLGDETVGHEVFTNNDGTIRLKSDWFGKFWRRSPNWIWADSNDTGCGNPDTLFWPVQIDDTHVALRNEGNKNFCKRLTTEGKTSCLNAAVSNISLEARFELVERLISRKIDDVKFNIKDARIYDHQNVLVATQTVTNSTDEANVAHLKFTSTKTESTTWKTSLSFKVGVKTTLKTGIPMVVDGKVEISAELGTSFEFGKTTQKTSALDTSYDVKVPPMTTVTVRMLVVMGSCDVAFSYTQTDVLHNGEKVVYHMDDGIFTGTNCFKIKYETENEKL